MNRGVRVREREREKQKEEREGRAAERRQERGLGPSFSPLEKRAVGATARRRGPDKNRCMPPLSGYCYIIITAIMYTTIIYTTCLTNDSSISNITNYSSNITPCYYSSNLVISL